MDWCTGSGGSTSYRRESRLAVLARYHVVGQEVSSSRSGKIGGA